MTENYQNGIFFSSSDVAVDNVDYFAFLDGKLYCRYSILVYSSCV